MYSPCYQIFWNLVISELILWYYNLVKSSIHLNFIIQWLVFNRGWLRIEIPKFLQLLYSKFLCVTIQASGDAISITIIQTIEFRIIASKTGVDGSWEEIKNQNMISKLDYGQ